MDLSSLLYKRGKEFLVLDQLLLPDEKVYIPIKNSIDAWKVIRTMQVRGAPLIAIVAVLGLAVEAHELASACTSTSTSTSTSTFTACSSVSVVADAESMKAFLLERMQYLRTSRPTAVNLFIATDECAAVVCSASAKEFATMTDVANAFIEAAESILVNDLIANKAMGKHGAQHILQIVQDRKKSKKIFIPEGQRGQSIHFTNSNDVSASSSTITSTNTSDNTNTNANDCSHITGSGGSGLRVLTICNTGTLATSGFGTALGVVRTLFELKQLEHVYACETRPYNQGARLTAFEIMQDGLPGSLITDSMIGTLMYTRGIDCVVVGADRIAANGDTANKIGTYNLAITAAYHKVPFFVVAPTTTFDLSMKSGAEIPVEERPEHEMTTIFGHRLAPEGMPAWNPAFDVTPSKLITGIVTEVGVAEAIAHKDNVDHIIDIPAFLQDHGKSNLITSSCVSVRTNAPAGFKVMTAELLKGYLLELPDIRELLGIEVVDLDLHRGASTITSASSSSSSSSQSSAAESNSAQPPLLDIREVGDGNLNFVYIITHVGLNGECKRLVVKQALPYIRVVESWPLTLDRAGFETRALQQQRQICPKHVPQVYHYNPILALLIMEFVPDPHMILRKAFIKGIRFTTFAGHLSTFLAHTLYRTSILACSGSEFRTNVSQWSKNVQLCALTERVVFTDPYTVTDANRWTSPHLDLYAKFFREDIHIKCAAVLFKERFLTVTQCLIHGDLHSGSVMACEGSTYIIDPEFAFYGPMGFDIGAIIANILLSFFSQAAATNAEEEEEEEEEEGEEKKSPFSTWLLHQMVFMYEQFELQFLELWDSDIAQGNGNGDGNGNGNGKHIGELCYADVFVYPTTDKDTTANSLTQKRFMKQLWYDTLGFAGMKIIRRILGIAHVEDIEGILDVDVKAACERRALMLAKNMLLKASYAFIQNDDNSCANEMTSYEGEGEKEQEKEQEKEKEENKGKGSIILDNIHALATAATLEYSKHYKEFE